MNLANLSRLAKIHSMPFRTGGRNEKVGVIMKKVIKIVLPLIIVVAFAASVNWGYVSHFLGIVGNAAISAVTNVDSDGSELEEEIKNLSVDKFFNFDKMKDSVDVSIKDVTDAISPSGSPNPLESPGPIDDKLKDYVPDSFASQAEFKEHEHDIWHSDQLTKEEKVYVDGLCFEKLTKEQRKDLNVYSDPRVIKNGDYEDWGNWPSIDWPLDMGLDLDKSIEGISELHRVPQDLDRYGALTGTNFSVIGKSGDFANRAIPYIENPEAYNQYKYFDNKNYRELLDLLWETKDKGELGDKEAKALALNINKNVVKNIITKGYTVEAVTDKEAKAFRAQYLDYLESAKAVRKDYKKAVLKIKYGLMGYAAPWYADNTNRTGAEYYPGGARQVNIAVKGQTLHRLCILRENP